MTAVLTPLDIHESRVVLPNVRWDTYEHLLSDLENCTAPRLTYDRGDLEITSPTPKYERLNDAVKIVVNIIAQECGIKAVGFGSTTFRREDLSAASSRTRAFIFRTSLW